MKSPVQIGMQGSRQITPKPRWSFRLILIIVSRQQLNINHHLQCSDKTDLPFNLTVGFIVAYGMWWKMLWCCTIVNQSSAGICFLVPESERMLDVPATLVQLRFLNGISKGGKRWQDCQRLTEFLSPHLTYCPAFPLSSLLLLLILSLISALFTFNWRTWAHNLLDKCENSKMIS